MNPWIGVSLIALGITGTVVFSVLKIPVGTDLSALIALGITLVQAQNHSNTLVKYRALKAHLSDNAPK